MNPVKRLFAYYTTYHAHGPLFLRYVSLIGMLGFPAFYLLRFTKESTPYDDLALRLLNAALCAILFFKDQWPQRLRPYYFAYSYAVLIITLPLTFVFTSLKHGGGTIAVGNTLMAAFLIILLADWRNMVVILLAGFGGAIGLYVLTDPRPEMPADYVQRLPILFITVVGGSLFKHALERATAERVRQAYASLAGSIAHEMRNPLGQIRHSLESLRQSLPVPTAKAQAQVLNSQEVESLYRHLAQGDIAVERGLQVISMTLDEVNAKPLNPVGFAYLSAAEVCDKAVLEYGYESQEQRSRVSVETRSDFLFRGEETAFLFVLFNLIKNALYYLPAYPLARVAIVIQTGTVSVRDTGPGIPADLQRRLFEPFRSSKSGGTGLGLAYCRRVMRAFGGDITCQSAPGDTRFTMTFPPVTARERELYREAIMAKAKAVFVRRRLLVVDDDGALRKTTRLKLKPVEAVVDEAADGREALAMLSNFRYDLVLLDVDMPHVDGYEVAEQIRAGLAPVNRDVCIVAYTSEQGPAARVKALKAGMDGLVSKPCEQEALLHALCRALESPGGRARLEHGQLAGQRVLLADDNAYNRKAVAAYLRRAGVDVVEAGTGEAVMEQLSVGGRAWDAVLLDINMPGMSGLDTARAIRASSLPCRGVPIVALTAHSGADVMAAAQAAGMGDFITKPVDAAVLYGKLRQITSRDPARDTAPIPAEPGAIEGLLNLDRLERYREIGMLEELVGDYVPEIERIVVRLQAACDRSDLDQCLELLHSLVGLSGEAGAATLHRLARQVYVQMSQERCMPAQPNWVGPIRAMTTESARALSEYGGERAGRT
ncbi:MAG: response regulator [Ramlibacter sp.]|nr:response regulator [Ramlibacter sp.]